MTVKINVYDGAQGIGGNKILFEADGTSLMLDFGLNFKTNGIFFDDYLKPRSHQGIWDYVEFGIVPPLAGIYRDELIPDTAESRHIKLGALPNGKIDGVFISHAHADHIGCLGFLREEIPIYTGLTTAIIMKAIQDMSKMSDPGQEICYTKSRELKNGALKAVSGQCRQQRPFRVLDRSEIPDEAKKYWQAHYAKTGSPYSEQLCPLAGHDMKMGALPVRYWPVDHSVPGAGALAIQTSSGWVVYSGDLRLHGKQGPLTERFFEEAAQLKPFAMITEGTHPTTDKTIRTEQEVKESILRVATGDKSKRRLIIADFGGRNIERLEIVAAAARASGRKLVVTAKDAFLVKHLIGAGTYSSLKDSFLVYQPKKAKAESLWEAEAVCEFGAVHSEEIRKKPGDYILCFSYYDFSNLPDIQPYGAIYIYSSSEPFNEEAQIDFERLKAWVQKYKMEWAGGSDWGEEGEFHASGHIDGFGLKKMIDTIRPQILLPIHTETPEFFEQFAGPELKVIFPQNGQEIRLA